MKKLNVKFKVGQLVECTLGANKGIQFVIVGVLDNKNMYSLQIADGSNDKYYGYDDSTLIAIEEV